MSAPVATAVTESQIDLSWTDLGSPDNGNSAITKYVLIWNNGGANTNIQLLEALQTTLQVTGLTGGETYKFMVRAHNIYGAGAFSSELVVVASDKHDKVDIPTVTIGTADTNVAISWTKPDEHSATIDAYEIQVQKADGSFEASSDCNGALQTVVDNLSCTIAMTNLVTLTSLPVDSVIKVRIRAHNGGGWGDYSETNTGTATIETFPAQMPPPVFNLAGSS